MLKRLESSWRSFEVTVENLLLKMAEWLKKHAPERFAMWEGTNRRWWRVVQEHIQERLQEEEDAHAPLPPLIRGAGGFVPNAPEEEDAHAPLPPLIRGAGGFVSNPSEEEDDLASIETEDAFMPDDHDVDRLF